MSEEKKRHSYETDFSIGRPEIAFRVPRMSAGLKTCDMSDILALIAYMQFSIG